MPSRSFLPFTLPAGAGVSSPGKPHNSMAGGERSVVEPNTEQRGSTPPVPGISPLRALSIHPLFLAVSSQEPRTCWEPRTRRLSCKTPVSFLLLERHLLDAQRHSSA